MVNRADGGLTIVMKHTNIADFTSKGNIPMESDLDRKDRMGQSSNAMTDREAGAVQKTPYRISLQSIRDSISHIEYWNPMTMPHMTICLAILQNGFALVGKSTPADPENFDEQLGRKFAYEDAERQAWPLFAFALREKLSGSPCMVIPVDDAAQNAQNVQNADPDDL